MSALPGSISAGQLSGPPQPVGQLSGPPQSASQLSGTPQPASQLNAPMPFNAGGNPFGQDLAGAYQSSYNSALAQNQALYGNILGGYNQALAQQVQGQGSVQQRYDNLGGQVMNTIQDITASQRQNISDVYAQQSGQLAQSMINSGLGNTTVQGSMQRGLTLDEQKAQIALANQQAQLSAGYQAQLGSAAAGYAGQSVAAQTAEQNLGLGWMNTITAQYPNAQSYGQLQYNQGLLNALQGGQGLAAGYGAGGGVGGGLAPPIPPGSPPMGNPLNYGLGGGQSVVYGGGAIAPPTMNSLPSDAGPLWGQQTFDPTAAANQYQGNNSPASAIDYAASDYGGPTMNPLYQTPDTTGLNMGYGGDAGY